MMMYDHGMPPGPKQSPNADINIEYQHEFENGRRFRQDWQRRFRRPTGRTPELSGHDRNQHGGDGFDTV